MNFLAFFWNLSSKIELYRYLWPLIFALLTFRHDSYLEGLEKCNNIGSDLKERMIKRAAEESRHEDALLLQKIGLKRFTAQFMTVPVQFMKELTHMVYLTVCLKTLL